MAQLGLAHTDTLLTKGNLAILLKQLGSGRRRSGCSRRMVVAGQTAQPRLDHTSNLATKGDLVVLLEDMEERAEAAVQSAAGSSSECVGDLSSSRLSLPCTTFALYHLFCA